MIASISTGRSGQFRQPSALLRQRAPNLHRMRWHVQHTEMIDGEQHQDVRCNRQSGEGARIHTINEQQAGDDQRMFR